MGKVSYRHVDDDGYFTFHVADGSAVTVSAKGYSTADPSQIAVLDACPFVKRTKSSSDDGGKEA